MKNLKYLLMVAAVCAISSCTREVEPQKEVNQTPEAAYNGGEVEKGWVRIKLQESAQPFKIGAFTRGAAESGNPELDKIAEELGATEIIRVFQDGGKFAERRRKYGFHLWYDVKFDEEVPVTRAMTRFQSLEGVQYIEPIYKAFLVSDNMSLPADAVYAPSYTYEVSRPEEMPFNDPQLKNQWHYNNTGGTGYTVGSDINLFEAWKIETGKPNVIVSIHDEGVDVTHEDLVANMWVNSGEIPGNGIDDDDNGYIDDINGWSWVNYSARINKDHHGTHVAGTVAAVNNNGIGVSGVAGGDGTPNSGARIMSCNVIVSGASIVSSAPESYLYAADNGAVISQNSWTLGRTGELPKSYDTAFQYFIDNAGVDENGNQTGPMKGGIIIFASANTGGPTFIPAASDKVIAVASTGPNYELTNYSNRGPEIAIIAPGGQGNSEGIIRVLSTGNSDAAKVYIPNSYSALWGTSMACPHVSGIAALVVSKFGKQGFTAAECKTRLLNGYRPVGGYVKEENLGNVGVGIADAAIALMEAPKKAPGTVEAAAVSTKDNTLIFSWKVPADGNGLAVRQYIVEYTGTIPNASRADVKTTTLENHFDIGKTVKFNVKAEYNRNYKINVFSVDRYGNKSGAVELSATTVNFDNKAPVRKKSIPDATIAAPGADNKMTYTMSDYISDPNTSQGDVLTYTVVSSKEAVAKGEIVDGGTLVVTPMAKGTTMITVTATDIAGESAKVVFNVTVQTGSEAQVGGAVMIYPSTVASDLAFELSEIKSANVEIVLYDSAARKVMSKTVAVDALGKGTVSVAALAPGTYTFIVKSDGAQLKSSFVKK